VRSSLLTDPFDQTVVSISQSCTYLLSETIKSGILLPDFVFHHVSLKYFLTFEGKLCFYCKNENYTYSVLCKKWAEGNGRNYCLLKKWKLLSCYCYHSSFPVCFTLTLITISTNYVLLFPFSLPFQLLIMY